MPQLSYIFYLYFGRHELWKAFEVLLLALPVLSSLTEQSRAQCPALPHLKQVPELDESTWLALPSELESDDHFGQSRDQCPSCPHLKQEELVLPPENWLLVLSNCVDNARWLVAEV